MNKYIEEKTKKTKLEGGENGTIMNFEKVTKYFEGEKIIYLATAKNNKPKVRPMALIYHGEQFWCCTLSNRKKVHQIENNENIEFALLVNDDGDFVNIRGEGKAKIIQDSETKIKLSQVITFFGDYFKSTDDPNYVLIHMDIEKFEVRNSKTKKIFHKK